MCTYENLVAATLPHGLIPLVVPQLRTITLGGAVTGLGIESTRSATGCPHESVLEMDVFTGAGEVRHRRRPGDDLFDAFPNSYGSLGYATRLRIELEPVPAYVAPAARALRRPGAAGQERSPRSSESGECDGERVDGIDGVAFSPGESYLTLARWTTPPGADAATTPGQQIYYRSIQRARDRPAHHARLPLALGHRLVLVLAGRSARSTRVVRRLWPRRWRRSDVYHRLVGLDRRFGVADRLDRGPGAPSASGYPGRRGAGRAAGRSSWPGSTTRSGCGRCGCARCAADARLAARTRCRRTPPTSTSASGAPSTSAPSADDAPRNRAIEAKVHELGGHKSLYSEAFYDRDTFDQLYGGAHLARVKQRVRPRRRLTSLYDKAVGRR